MTGLDLSKSLSNVKTILVQFAFSNEEVIPKWLRSEKKETLEEKKERMTQTADGKKLIEKHENVSVSSIFFELQKAGFHLNDGYSKELFKKDFGTYFVARFTFSRQASKFDEIRFAKKSLECLCERAFWDTKAFINPSSVEDGRESFVSVNMTGRKPIYQKDGSLVRKWETDESGNRVGTGPLPIAPTGILKLTRKGSLTIVAA